MTNYTYDDASQLTNLAHTLGASTLSSFGYSYDLVGNRTTNNQQRSTVLVNPNLNYVYDNLYRLTQATNPLPALPSETFNYDSLGNRLRKSGQSTNAVFDQNNRLVSDQDFNYSYDTNGNMVSKTAKAGGAVTGYTYDAENQLINYQSSGVNAQYKYDGLGRRIEKVVNGVITRYVYDNEDIILEYNGNNMLQASYSYGAGIDEPLIMSRNSSNFYYHADGLGSIVDLTDSSGTVVQSYVYDSFGNIVSQTGSLTNPYTYTGREFDSESGLYYYRRRYYDPSIGRFISRDPIGFAGGINHYTYVYNNPVNNTDPFGLLTKGDCDTIYEAEVAACMSLPSKKDRAVCLAEAADDYARCLRNADDDPSPDPNPGPRDNNGSCPINPPTTPPVIPPNIPPIGPGPIGPAPIPSNPILGLGLNQFTQSSQSN